MLKTYHPLFLPVELLMIDLLYYQQVRHWWSLFEDLKESSIANDLHLCEIHREGEETEEQLWFLVLDCLYKAVVDYENLPHNVQMEAADDDDGGGDA